MLLLMRFILDLSGVESMTLCWWGSGYGGWLEFGICYLDIFTGVWMEVPGTFTNT